MACLVSQPVATRSGFLAANVGLHQCEDLSKDLAIWTAFALMENKKTSNKPIPYLSLCGAIGFAVSIIALTILERVDSHESSIDAQQMRVLKVMVCMLLASWSSIVSLVTAWCPIILGGDRRPLFWVIPLILGWIVFGQLYDWSWVVPNRP